MDNYRQQTRERWLYASMIVLLGFVVVTFAIFHFQRDNEVTLSARLDPSCDLNQETCQSQFPDGSKVSLSVRPRPIKGLKPLQLQVEIEGIEAQSVEVDFHGIGMNMGYNRPKLRQESARTYSGTWVLAACALERMLWQATILIRTGDGVLSAPFRFEVTVP